MPGAIDAAASDSQVRALARAILERPRYKNFRPDNYDILRIFSEAWREFLSFVLGLYDSNRSLYWLLVIGLGLVCSLLLAHIAWTLATALRALPPALPSASPPEELDFARESAELAARGEHLEAAHRLLLASLRALAKGRHIALSPEHGNRAICRQLAASELPKPLREQLIALIMQTERAWFGAARDPDAGADLYGRWRAAHAQLSRTTPR